MRLEKFYKDFKSTSAVSSSFHQNASEGYFQIDNDGSRKFVPYDKNEMGKIHGLLSPGKNHYNHMKWTKTHEWKDQEKAKKSRWKKTRIAGGLNTVSK